MFELVLRLKQICNFDPVTGSSVKLERLVADMEEVAASGKKANRLQSVGRQHRQDGAGAGAVQSAGVSRSRATQEA